MKRYILILVGFLSLTMVSCKKFLEEEPFDFIGVANFYKTEGDANAALTGAFSALQPQSYYGRTQWLVNELSGDLVRLAPGTAGDRLELYTQTMAPTNGEIGNWWNNSYLLINRANDIILNVPNIAMDVTKRNNIVGNARFLRGMAYFDLVRSYGSVPLLLNPTIDLSSLTPVKASTAAIYAQIIEDFKFAEANCLVETSIPATQKGRVSSGAAATLLAKAYLTRAASTDAVGTDYADALAACNRVIASNVYSTSTTPYADIFDVTKEITNKEVIFAVHFDLPPNVGNIIVRQSLPTTVGGGFGSFFVEPWFDASFATGDIRKPLTISTAGAFTYFSKFRDPGRIGNDARSNFIVTRYADVLLMQSEALNAINPLDPNKMNGINAVRARAGVPALLIVNYPTKESFVDALLQERAWELSLEGHRRFDLLRLNRYKSQQLAIYGRNVADKYLLLPIPQNEIALNPNLLPNNGY